MSIGDHGRSLREEDISSISEQDALKAANKDVLVRIRSHSLILMANTAMAGGLPFYF